MHSPAQSPILDVTETLSLHSDLEGDFEPKKKLPSSSSYSFPAPHSLRLPGLGFPGLVPGSKVSPGSVAPTLPAFEYIAPPSHALQALEFPLMELNRVGVIGGGMFPGFMHRRVRGEKRPIPDAQKDAKYYERRKRNNEAAKKSRDARKIREDRIAFRAALLEQENSILRAQVLALRDELQTVRQLLGATTAAGGMLSMTRQV
ncbi:hepatic leukemia factor [Drosophila serrata]|uniref:hepatic leukemia factor n=1 Tax=Drosophila serrata TaxID=7274 RepID=UPI000A1D1740|nr:hepatic leukemia factor [Drosophila serrata]